MSPATLARALFETFTARSWASASDMERAHYTQRADSLMKLVERIGETGNE